MRKYSPKHTLLELLLLLAVVAAIFIPISIGLGMWDRPSDSETALHSAGFSEVVVGDHAYFECGRGDVSSLAFTATNPNGDRVSGTVCCGWFKGCTVRF